MESPKRPEDRNRLSDDEAIAMLQTLLTLRREAEAVPISFRHAAYGAVLESGILVRGIIGWAARDLGLWPSKEEYERLSAEDRRALLSVSIAFGLPILQFQAASEIADALIGLNGGEEQELLRKSGVGRRRAEPFQAADAEFDLLKYIRWQHGRGRKVADAEAEVAQAVGCTIDAIRKWRTEIVKVFGERRVHWHLMLAEAVGIVETRLGDDVDFEPWESNAGHWLWLASQQIPRDIHPVVARRRHAIAKRR
jgi:hypothetical protein